MKTEWIVMLGQIKYRQLIHAARYDHDLETQENIGVSVCTRSRLRIPADANLALMPWCHGLYIA